MDIVCGVLLLFVFGGQPFYFRRVREIIIEPSLGNSQRLFSLNSSRLLQGKVETIGFHMAFEKWVVSQKGSKTQEGCSRWQKKQGQREGHVWLNRGGPRGEVI